MTSTPALPLRAELEEAIAGLELRSVHFAVRRDVRKFIAES
ncbi:MAG: hypothetical protein R3C02_14285 [Planctomycetaceae bacterium]